ncbi:acyclic terpene utilization AtuA family protein [Microvirga antarctica]|uniref:acyclic terpene utilization AtuA family protein n=1 Tax=Microvirga antarctica TaxID=2819233 RepID=UPI001B30EF83|nr:acyclic terpene utilization AtuA family protein [Microvirga antarctica]
MSKTATSEVRVLSATGVCGSGFKESSLLAGMARRPHFIGCDAGSTDPGPGPLGAGTTAFPLRSIKRDLRLMLKAALDANVPLLVGSAGTAGGAPHLAAVRDIVLEIAREEGLRFRLALIHAEQDKTYLKKRLSEGRIRPLSPAPKFDADAIDRAERIVGMMGEEPFLEALDHGADVVIAGRASDCAIFAGLPIRLGVAPGLAWHAAKLLECGSAIAVSRPSPDSTFVTFRGDHFDIDALDPNVRCTPQSVAAHALYENADPYRLVESSGVLDLTQASYQAIDARSVRVRGSRFDKAETYTVKLEGSEHVGYQSIVIGSIRDPYIIRQIDDWCDRLRQKLLARVGDVFGDRPVEHLFNIRLYGKDGTMGPLEPERDGPTHELCVVLEVTASTQEIATTIVSLARHQALHLPIPEWSGLITGFACPYSPAYLERGAVYRFCVNHVLAPDHPCEMFPIDYLDVE